MNKNLVEALYYTGIILLIVGSSLVDLKGVDVNPTTIHVLLLISTAFLIIFGKPDLDNE